LLLSYIDWILVPRNSTTQDEMQILAILAVSPVKLHLLWLAAALLCV